MKLLLFVLCLAPVVICVEKTCGGTYRGFQYTITSPNYPQNYSDGLNCVYRFQGDIWDKCEQEFQLQFLDFNVNGLDNCRGDYLQVGDRHILCGNVTGLRKFKGANNSLSVVFHSDERDSEKGFKIIVTAVPCTLKFNHNHFYRGFTEEGRDDFAANDLPKIANYREINKDIKSDGNNSRIRFSPAANNNSYNLSSSSPLFFDQNSASKYPQINDPSKSSLNAKSSKPWSFKDTLSNKKSTRISSYLFVPPSENNTSISNNLTLKTNDKGFIAATSALNDFSLPSQTASSFLNVRFSSDKSALESLDKSSSSSENIRKTVAVPSRNYGEPGLGIVDYDLQVANDCDKNVYSGSAIRNNYNSFEDQRAATPVTALGSPSNIIYNSQKGFVDNFNSNDINNPLPNYSKRYYQGDYSNRIFNARYPFGASNVLGNSSPIRINNPTGYLGNNYNINTGASNYPPIGFNPYNKYPISVNYPPTYANLANNYGFNSAYNPVRPFYNSAYNSIPSNYNSVYNPEYTTGFTPSLGGYYYQNSVNNWGNGYYWQSRECCHVQSSRRFSIVSPGFPGALSSGNTFSCRYTITKSSPDVCRLRLNFRFFNFGGDDQYCSFGYIEIDGRRYCGCKTGLSLQVSFIDYIAKSMFIMNSGYPRSKFSGFLIDIVQESCGGSGSYPSYSSYPSYPSYPYSPAYQYDSRYPGNFQRRKDELHSTTDKRSSLNPPRNDIINPSVPDPNPHIRNKRNLGYSYARPNVPFQSNGIQTVSNVIGTQERFLEGRCQNRVFLDWVIVSKEAFFKHVRCGGFGVYNPNTQISYPISRNGRSVPSTSSECEEINVNHGEITTPLYPSNYPENIKLCYRFKKVPNYCSVEINVQDFDIEQSNGCTKDYVSISKEDTKYCGNSLKNFKTVLDLTKVNSMDIYFVSDSHGTGKGFNISFSQLPC